MDFYDKTIDYVEKYTSSDIKSGLSAGNLNNSVKRYGYNALSKKKNKSLGKRILDSLKEPMLLILIFSFCVAYNMLFQDPVNILGKGTIIYLCQHFYVLGNISIYGNAYFRF